MAIADRAQLCARGSTPWNRNLSTFQVTFEDLVEQYWTTERVEGLAAGKELLLQPQQQDVAKLLRVMGLMAADATIGLEKIRKFKQVNALLMAVETSLSQQITTPTFRPLRFLELCTGRSHLSLVLAYAAKNRWGRPINILAVDQCPKRIAVAKLRAHQLGYSEWLRFRTSAVSDLVEWEREYTAVFPEDRNVGPPDAVLSLHACDTATDEALAYGAFAGSETLLVAPCCQVELARKWAALQKPRHPLALVHRTGSLRTEMAAHTTDALRIALLRCSGYAVDASKFVPAEHTPKNRLIVASKIPDDVAGEQETSAFRELKGLKRATGGESIVLEEMLQKTWGVRERYAKVHAEPPSFYQKKAPAAQPEPAKRSRNEAEFLCMDLSSARRRRSTYSPPLK